MTSESGSNLSDIKFQNRALILKLVATQSSVSRADLSRMTGLTKTTASKIVSGLIEENIICERDEDTAEIDTSVGRKPIFLDISPKSPCICGMLIKRGLCSVVFSDYKGRIFAQKDYEYKQKIDSDMLIAILLTNFYSLKSIHKRPILAIGISSIGPVDIVNQKLVNPPNFFGINNTPIVQIIQEKTNIKTYIINDSNAGALAEKIYGKGQTLNNFVYLHIMNGIGAGYVFHDRIYNGDMGQSGEIGHTSINFSGPVCDCGNTGCLELYANLQNMNNKIQKLKSIYPSSHYLSGNKAEYSWKEIVYAANKLDYYAVSALDEFCEYISYALANTMNLLDINHILVGYDSDTADTMIENMLSAKLNSRVLVARYRDIKVEKSTFGGNAPLIGSIALITDKIFSGEIEF